MTETVQASESPEQSRKRFNNELKMFVNQRLFEKKLISEDMYESVKALLIKQAG